jgi:hypothetical protein
MKKFFNLLSSDRIVKWSITFAIFLLVAESIYIGILFFSLPPFLPLFNQMPWGEERLGSRLEIFLPILITMLFFVINIFLLMRLYEKMPLISRMLSITSLLITALSFIFIVRTLQLIP